MHEFKVLGCTNGGEDKHYGPHHIYVIILC